jgi:NAD(P)-dependent dehydrogenase (short-subunit alcohol dehydrogenase family)
MRQMSQARHVGKIVVSAPFLPLSKGAGSGGSGRVVITGGLGSLGLLTARWLLQQGVRRLLLVGRSGRGDAAELAALLAQQPEAEISACAADMACAEDLALVLAPGEVQLQVGQGAG